jgi:carbamoyltransferase
MIILGVNAFHGDSSAALLRDGILVAAAEEERFKRVKHWAGLPSDAIGYCLTEGRINLSDVDYIAINQNNRANLLRKMRYVAGNFTNVGLVFERIRNRAARERLPDMLDKAFPGKPFRGSLYNVEHHLAHLASAFYVSPFSEAVVVSVDGFGDFASAAWGVGRGKKIEINGRVLFPHSLGVFYQALTQYLGFPNYGDEYKVMGLAPYGTVALVTEMRELIDIAPDGTFKLNLKYFNHHRKRIAHQWSGGAPEFADLFSPALEELLGPRRKPTQPLENRHRDIARSVQVMYEEAFFHLIRTLQKRSGVANIALAGGCAMNSVANGKVRRVTDFRRVYVQAAAGDAGGAIGAAYALWHSLGGARLFVMEHGYWGPQFNRREIASVLDKARRQVADAHCAIREIDDEAELCQEVARAISEGKVIGWFQGRMEWGPRALGNRSILCDPRRSDMKELLNAKIKRRESFRPFAPSVLEEAVPHWFEEDDAVPFMMQVFQIRPERRREIPAVTHVDGSGRLQTVCRSTNPRYYRLIETFAKMTGVPMVLNTSFNENEPVVCRPEEALSCFLRTKMDLLVLGDTVITRLPSGTNKNVEAALNTVHASREN